MRSDGGRNKRIERDSSGNCQLTGGCYMEEKISSWLVKVFAEFGLALLLTLVVLFIGGSLGIIEQGERIVVERIEAPIYIALFIVLYKTFHCTFPVKGMKPGR